MIDVFSGQNLPSDDRRLGEYCREQLLRCHVCRMNIFYDVNVIEYSDDRRYGKYC